MTSPIVVLRTIDASPSDLFALWVSPDTLVAPVTSVAMTAEVGGEIRISTGSEPAADLTGRFVAVEPPNRLRYTWRWGGTAEESLVDVRFNPAGDATVVEVHHSGFLDENSRQTHLDGWIHYLDSLPALL